MKSSSIQNEIHEKALQLAKEYRRSEADLIDILEQVDAKKVFIEMGCSSLFQYTITKLGLSESVAYNLIAVMRKAKEVPNLKTEIRSGKITLSNARKIAPVLNSENQSEWLMKASSLSQRQLEKEIVKVRPQNATPERASYVTESRIKLELGLFEKDLLKLRRAQDLLSQKTSRSATLEETLLDLLAVYLKQKDPIEKAKRVLVKKGFVSALPVSRQVQNEINLTLSESQTNSLPSPKLAVKKLRAPIPAHLLHQVNFRDQRQCTHVTQEGKRCTQKRWLEIHHPKPVSEGGKNTLENLTTLCSIHHRAHHHRH